MIETSEEFATAAAGSRVQRVRVESWFDGEQLTDDIPIEEGELTVDRSQNIQERLRIIVPREDRGVSWAPVEAEHPLGAYGQQLAVSIGIDISPGITEWIPVAWLLVTQTVTHDNTVEVTASSMLSLIEEANFVSPFQPDGTIISTIRDLVEPALTVTFDDGLVDRSIPAGMQWDTDRFRAFTEVIDAWPAEYIHLPDGTLYIRETIGPLITHPNVARFPDDIVWEIDDTGGDGSTVIEWEGTSDRDGLFNLVVSRGEDDEGNPIQGVASNIESVSPTRIGGPFNPLDVPFEFHSPLLTSVEACRHSAGLILRQKTRIQTQRVNVRTIPNPALQVGDTILVLSNDESLHLNEATVEAFTLPLTPEGGPMNISLHVYERRRDIILWQGLNISPPRD